MRLLLFAAVATFFLPAYRIYGGFLERRLGLDESRATPSHAEYDGVARVPARRMVLLDHHFSSNAGAAFGWLPALVNGVPHGLNGGDEHLGADDPVCPLLDIRQGYGSWTGYGHMKPSKS